MSCPASPRTGSIQMGCRASGGALGGPQGPSPLGMGLPRPLGAGGVCQGAGWHWARPSPPQELLQCQALRQWPAAPSIPGRSEYLLLPAGTPCGLGGRPTQLLTADGSSCPQLSPRRGPYQLVSKSPAPRQAPQARRPGQPHSEVPQTWLQGRGDTDSDPQTLGG